MSDITEQEISEVNELCRLLTEAAKMCGPTKAGMACIDAQHLITSELVQKVLGNCVRDAVEMHARMAYRFTPE